jgi:hypothetical protein
MVSSVTLLSGDIVLVELTANFSYSDKERTKYALWINSGNGYFFLINSKNYDWAATETICLTPSDIPSIKKKCYLNLTELIPMSLMSITDKNIKKLGALPKEYMNKVKQIIENSRMLTPDQIKLVLDAFANDETGNGSG